MAIKESREKNHHNSDEGPILYNPQHENHNGKVHKVHQSINTVITITKIMFTHFMMVNTTSN